MPAKKDAKKDPMDAVLSNIEKQMGNRGGKSAFARFGKIETSDVPVISFGLKPIDEASYCGGIPRGKLIEVFGPESSGKSLLSLYLIASAQKQGLECALLDVEQSFDPKWAAQHGVDVANLVYSNDFTSGEHALEYANKFCRSGAFGLVVIDSTAALIPKGELEGTLEDEARVGAQARMLSRGCPKIVDGCGKTDTTCLFINQIREKIGVKWGNPETTPGGRALKFYSHQRVCVRKGSKIKVKENGVDIVVGQLSTVTFVKNKTARPFGQAEFKIIFDPQSLNPVVMLANALRSQKLIKVYKGLFNIPKDTLGNKQKIETGTTTIIELADFLIANDYVLPFIDELILETENDPTADKIDDAILEMKEDPSKIVSPTNAKISMNVEKIEDADPNEIPPDHLTEENIEEVKKTEEAEE